jgi:hypothetical protein
MFKNFGPFLWQSTHSFRYYELKINLNSPYWKTTAVWSAVTLPIYSLLFIKHSSWNFAYCNSFILKIYLCRSNYKERTIRNGRKFWRPLSRNSSVGIATGYGLEGWGSVPGRGKIFSLLWGPPSSYRMGSAGCLPWYKAAGAWSWPLASI